MMDSACDLTNGITKVITVTYSVASSVSPGPMSNTATASASGATTLYDTSSVTLSLHSFPTRRSSDLDASVNAGTSAHTFTISVTNNGPSDAVGVHLTDAVPTALTVTIGRAHV